MTTSVSIVDEAEFQEYLSDVRSDLTDTNWFLCGHTDSPDEIVFVGSGAGGVAELTDHLDDSRYMYGLVRMTVTIDMSETTKFAYIYWVGKEVPFAKRGKFGVKSGSIKDIFQPYQVSFEFDGDDKSTITGETILNKLEESSGTKSKVLDASEAKDRPERGFTAGASSGPSKAGNIGASVGRQGSSYSGVSRAATKNVKVNDEVRDLIAAVRSDQDTTINWMCAKFEGNNVKNPLVDGGSGDDCTKIGEVLNEDEVACVLMKANDIVDDIATVKFAYILWVGERVKPLTKGKMPTFKGELEELFKPFHVHIHATQPSEVRHHVIQDKIGSASGSKSNIK